MTKEGLNPETITGRINLKILELLKQNPEGLRWVDLTKMVQNSDPSIHPKTLNGCIWKLTENFPDKVERTDDKLFKLK